MANINIIKTANVRKQSFVTSLTGCTGVITSLGINRFPLALSSAAHSSLRMMGLYPNVVVRYSSDRVAGLVASTDANRRCLRIPSSR